MIGTATEDRYCEDNNRRVFILHRVDSLVERPFLGAPSTSRVDSLCSIGIAA